MPRMPRLPATIARWGRRFSAATEFPIPVSRSDLTGSHADRCWSRILATTSQYISRDSSRLQRSSQPNKPFQLDHGVNDYLADWVAVTLSAQDCDFAFRAKTLERRLFNMPGTGSYSQLFSHLIVSSFRRSEVREFNWFDLNDTQGGLPF